jgi:hypothetical protein
MNNREMNMDTYNEWKLFLYCFSLYIVFKKNATIHVTYLVENPLKKWRAYYKFW